MESKIRQTCESFFNIQLKQEQLDTLASYYVHQKDTILLAPTGYGKSIIYQAAPLLFNEDKYKPSTRSRVSSTIIKRHSNSSGSENNDILAAPDHSTPIRPEAEMMDVADSFNQTTVVDDVSYGIENMSLSTVTEEVQFRPIPQAESEVEVKPKEKPPSRSKVFAQFLVIMPLVAMVSEALTKMRKILPNVSAVHLTSATVEEAKHAAMIFTSPEAILQGAGRVLLETKSVADNIKAIFVDEFHIIASWGMSSNQQDAFRESYGHLGQLRAFTRAPIVCLSATAPTDVIQKVSSSLHLKSPAIFRVDINKLNISYHSVRVKGDIITDFRWLAHLLMSSLTSHKVPRMLIFFTNVNLLSDAYEYVTTMIGQTPGDSDPLVAMFQLLTNAKIKQTIISKLAEYGSKLKVVFCSSSLSMGMNLANIEYVIHYGVPTQASMFLQETGRAAREASIHGHSILMKFPRMSSGRKLEDTMKDYVKGTKCLREILLAKFKCTKKPEQQLCCDVCETIDCIIMDKINESYESSITDTFSDSDSVASIGDLEDHFDV